MYVSELQEEYEIEKTKNVMQYETIIEKPMGKQIQVDWGETRQKTKKILK